VILIYFVKTYNKTHINNLFFNPIRLREKCVVSEWNLAKSASLMEKPYVRYAWSFIATSPRAHLMPFERDGEIYFASAATHARNELAGRACKRVAVFRWKLLREVEGQGCGEAETIISQFAVRSLMIVYFHSRREKYPETRSCINLGGSDCRFRSTYLVLTHNRTL